MKLLSIHVGKPREVEHQGKTISTGIFKHKVDGPVRVNKLNLDGDGQADLKVHGGEEKAVYAYPAEHYSFWEAQRPDLSFSPGVFGENLSVSGLDEKEVCIGDVYRIGSAVFSVTIPRMPCSKLGIKMQDTAFVGEFMKEQRNGFYLEVLEEGTITPGDDIKKLEEDGHFLTVEEVIWLYTTGKEDPTLLNKAITSPSMSAARKTKYQKVLDGLS